MNTVADSPPILELQNVCKWFPDPKNGERLVTIDDISLSVPAEASGEFIALLGPSGSGKSTILNLISGLLAPDSGEVRVRGERVPMPNPWSVTVPQAYTCFPWLTVLGNAEFGLAIQGMPPAERHRVASDCLTRVGLGDRLTARPRELSGGMQQRVAIARTLAMKPPIVMMDEPFGALDAQTRADMQQMLVDLWIEEMNLIFFVTHDITEALLLADRVIVLSPRPAKIVFDTKVPFARPRQPSITMDNEFVTMGQAILHLLKQTPTTGQVRITV